ncbi:LemA family protein [Metamycoplasma phocicerebrale]|uniref:LemA family protein n=1 Tax=Metamycoplasma phocicerebrale TaxID=142649 RepID=A0A3T0TTD1_9BACT|nr:LemA family protein [Metamycoplasma phocicerebrale]AZZ65351.1 LemA family protein [Metamycoplasma phocicerebrale]
MLFDSRTPQEKEGFKPNVDNSIKHPEVSGGEKFLYVLFFILTFGLFIIAVISRRNSLLAQMNRIQEASSLIQAAEKKRRAILIKQLDTVKGYAQFEAKTLKEITKYRSKLSDLETEQDPAKINEALNSIQRGINIQFEQYPNLKADRTFLQFQTEISLQEDEIYSTIRHYNAIVRVFNSNIYQFWTNIVAKKMGAYNQPLFQASEQEKRDVDTSSLSTMFE